MLRKWGPALDHIEGWEYKSLKPPRELGSRPEAGVVGNQSGESPHKHSRGHRRNRSPTTMVPLYAIVLGKENSASSRLENEM